MADEMRERGASRAARRSRRRAEKPASATESRALLAKSKVWLERGGRVALSEWRVQLLEAIEATGSLTEAAQRVGVPYRTAWYKLKDVEESLGVKLLATQSGGAEGGHSDLTPAARDLIARFRRVTAGVSELVEARFRAEFADLLD